MNYNLDPLYADAKRRMEAEFAKKEVDGTLSRVHDKSHVMAVSSHGAATARALARGQGYGDVAERWGLLTAVAGLFHDIKRDPTEKEPHGPAGMMHFKELLSCEPYTQLGRDEVHAISRAIEEHEGSFRDIQTIFGDPIGDKTKILSSVVAHSILTGDKVLEASGPRVLERRSFFVGKERMIGPKADIKMFEYPKESHLAVLGETMVRLYAKNPIAEYPLWLRNFAENWHLVQYLFYRGLLQYAEMDEEQAAEFMFRKGFPKFTNELVGTVKRQKHLSGNYFGKDFPILSKGIKAIGAFIDDELNDLAQSSYELVETFATSESPEQAIDSYRPGELRHLNSFMKGIRDYRAAYEGFVSEFENNIVDAVARLAGR